MSENSPMVYRIQETHIFVSFDADPPTIFCTRKSRSSFLSSPSCLDKSLFDLKRQDESHNKPDNMTLTSIVVRTL